MIVIAGLLYAETSPADEIFSTEFLSDHPWKTDQPDRFFRDADREVFYAKMENAVPNYDPNRYCVTKTRLNPRKSFSLSWDLFIHDLAVYGHFSFGLYSADLLNENRTYIYLPQLISASTLNMKFSGYGGDSIGFKINFVSQSGSSHGFGSYGGGRSAYTGRWLRCRMEYDATTHVMTYSAIDKSTGAILRSGSRTGAAFDQEMLYLGMSQYPVGQNPSLIYATRPQDSAITEIDNIVLNGEFAPPPHFTQASGASWQGHLLLGSTDPGDTIAKYGCFLTSTAMLLQHFGHNTDPASLNAHVIATAPQSDGFLRFGELIPDAQGTYGQSDGWGASPVRFHHAVFSHTSTRSTIVASLEQAIRDSGPVILRVPQYGNGMKNFPDWQHAILAWKVTEGTVLIRDPGSARTGLPPDRDIDTLSLDDYVAYVRSSVSSPYQPDTDWQFLRGIRYTYAEQLESRSSAALVGTLNSPVEVVITAPDGRKIGRDPHSDTNFDGIPGSSIVRTTPIVAPDGSLMPSPSHTPADISLQNLTTGQYTLDVFGTDNGPWQVTLRLTGFGLTEAQSFSFSGTASPSSRETFTFDLVAPVQPIAPIISLTGRPDSLVLHWNSLIDQRYLVKRSYDLKTWTTISTDALVGVDSPVTYPLPAESAERAFYTLETLTNTEGGGSPNP